MTLPTASVWADQGSEWAKVAEVATYSDLSYAPRHLDVGQWSLTVPFDAQAAAFTRDRLVTFDWRGHRYTGQVDTFTPSSRNGAATLDLSGVSALGMLGWALAWPDPTLGIGSQPYHDPNSAAPLVGDAETVCRTLVSGNVVTRRGQTLTLAPNGHRGTAVRARPAFDNLLDLTTKKARKGGIGITVGLVEVSGTRAVLTVDFYEPQDRSLRVRFAEAGLTGWTQTEQAPSATRAIVGGAGTGASRRMRQVSTTASNASAADWGGHREVFVDGPQSFDNARAMMNEISNLIRLVQQ